MKLNPEVLLRASGLDALPLGALAKLEQFADALLDANQKINLFSRSVTAESEVAKQIALSLCPLRLQRCGHGQWVDIGSGGGFPVVPLCIVVNSIEYTALEPIAKRAYFLERTAQKLNLSNFEVIPRTVEEVIRLQPRRFWDTVSVKAVTDNGIALAWSSELLHPDGQFITFRPESESETAVHLLEKFGFEQTSRLHVKDLIDSIDLAVVSYKKL